LTELLWLSGSALFLTPHLLGLSLPKMEEAITFEQYLANKKIDANKFKSAEAAKYQELSYDFTQMNPNSFTAHYLYLINPIRRKYLLQAEPEQAKTKPAGAVRPKFKR
jgi:hypothetical protein